MIAKYFKDYDKHVIKKKKASPKAPGKKGKSATGGAIDIKSLKQRLSGIIPSFLTIDAVKAIDSTGFSPEGVDLVAYREYCPDIIDILGGYVPYELIHGLYHVVQDLDRDSLLEVLGKISTAKKLNMYAAEQVEEDAPGAIPSFIIAASSKYQFIELKNDIINYYLSKNVDYRHELDILVILNKGIVVKNWREKRSFIALETKEDTFLWFFILMNEYLDVKNLQDVDFRKYVKKEIRYNEY